jgi:hypothetical protein
MLANNVQQLAVIKVSTPSDVSTANRLTVDLRDFGMTEAAAKSVTDAIILERDGKVSASDDTASISGYNLVIAEGSTGFSAGVVYTVALVFGLIETIEGVDSTV